MARVIYRFLHFDVKRCTANGFADDVAGLAPVGIGAAAWSRLLGIAAIVFDNPRSGRHELEMGIRHDRKHTNDCE